ncbi:MAG: asparagine synthase (glutamine-hydrolyzing), partial [Alphaproteobacteria bacterium CG_4_10_14_0_8_um_filter_53_9]
MCGIFGSTGVAARDLSRAGRALATLSHRGPDGQNHTLKDGVFMGHARLSIIDLSDTGTQPLVADGAHLTVNGEIYGYTALRDELVREHGAVFQGTSDSEVMLHAARAFGFTDMLNRVEGMFALALQDTTANTLTLARDHAGIKPLYYGIKDGQLAWASELKALVAWYGEEALLPDATAVYDVLTYGYIPTPKSLYQGIFKLPPSSYLVWDLETGTITTPPTRYWTLETPMDVTDVNDAVALIRAAIGGSVKDQLIADVPLGAFLSGGTDSSIVCAEAVRHVRNLTTCSIGFEDRAVDETAFADAVAAHLGTRHISRTLGASYVNKHQHELRDWFDEPFTDTSAFPTFEVSSLAREHMTVVLTGDGGDEVFGGYSHYTQWYQRLTPWLGFLFPLRLPVAWIKNHAPAPFAALARKAEPFTLRDPLERMVRLRGHLTRADTLKKRWRRALAIPADYDDYWFYRAFYRTDLSPKRRAVWLDFFTAL